MHNRAMRAEFRTGEFDHPEGDAPAVRAVRRKHHPGSDRLLDRKRHARHDEDSLWVPIPVGFLGRHHTLGAAQAAMRKVLGLAPAPGS